MKHVLSAVLSGTLPRPEDTLLLRACLHAGESGRRACEAWLARPRSTDLPREAVKSFLPLLFRAVRTHSIGVSQSFLTILKTAALREELRTRTYRLIAGRVLSALANRIPPAIPIGGVVLAETVYPDPALRHSHDIEILVEPDDIDEVGRSLIALGFTASGTEKAGGLELVHASVCRSYCVGRCSRCRSTTPVSARSRGEQARRSSWARTYRFFRHPIS